RHGGRVLVVGDGRQGGERREEERGGAAVHGGNRSGRPELDRPTELDTLYKISMTTNRHPARRRPRSPGSNRSLWPGSTWDRACRELFAGDEHRMLAWGRRYLGAYPKV